MHGLLLDTDVLVDNFRGARRLTLGSKPLAYSVVTLCELFAGQYVDEAVVLATLGPCVAITVDRAIAERAGRIRRLTGIRTPDALIAATAVFHELELVTRNVRDFGRVDRLVIRDPRAIG